MTLTATHRELLSLALGNAQVHFEAVRADHARAAETAAVSAAQYERERAEAEAAEAPDEQSGMLGFAAFLLRESARVNQEAAAEVFDIGRVLTTLNLDPATTPPSAAHSAEVECAANLIVAAAVLRTYDDPTYLTISGELDTQARDLLDRFEEKNL